MGLREYNRKRDFTRTREPRGKRAATNAAPIFVVQKHDASHLHYDFRLELDSVLKSWAVPKGPDLDPAQKRLAMQVEDHPLDYANFEGVIPEGEYGGGTVMLWDRGTWEAIGDARKGYREGHFKFILHGEKLRGGWMLVRRGGKHSDPNERHWFLFKERDQFANTQKSITESKPLSVATRRDMDEIAAQADCILGSSGERKPQKKTRVSTQRADNPVSAKTRSRARSTRRARNISNHDAHATAIAGVTLTHPDKILYPEKGLTKRDLAEYYEQVADSMLPLVAGRPLALVRCPSGCDKPCFFQRHPGEQAPKHLSNVNVSLKAKPVVQLVIRNVASLIELVQLSVLEIHVWGCLARRLENPDRLIFDLDLDPAVEWSHVVTGAREVRRVLDELGLVSFVKTTGGRGLHIVVPIQPRVSWNDANRFCKSVADRIVRAAPDRYVATMSKIARNGKIFIDYLRNGRGATSIAAFSTRALADAPVSVPIRWEELTPRLRSDHFTVANVLSRISRLKKDPWVEMSKTRQTISKSMFKRLET